MDQFVRCADDAWQCQRGAKGQLYFFAGATTSFLRGKFPVLPLFGVMDAAKKSGSWVWFPIRDRLFAFEGFDIWVGGELGGGSFRTDSDSNIQPRKLSGAQVDYSDYRAGFGLTYSPSSNFTIALGEAIRSSARLISSGREKNTASIPLPISASRSNEILGRLLLDPPEQERGADERQHRADRHDHQIARKSWAPRDKDSPAGRRGRSA